MDDTPPESLDQAAAPQGTSLVGELFEFLRTNKKWWMLPFFVVLLLMGFLIFLSGTAAAPFIYTLF